LHALPLKKEETAKNLVPLKTRYKKTHYAEPDLQDKIFSEERPFAK